MARFWPRAALTCWAAASLGCAGRSLEGMWQGPLPGASDFEPCMIRLRTAGRFDYQCPLGRSGEGIYSLTHERLMVQVTSRTEDGRPELVNARPFFARVEGPGNQIRLNPEDGSQPITWRRRSP